MKTWDDIYEMCKSVIGRSKDIVNEKIFFGGARANGKSNADRIIWENKMIEKGRAYFGSARTFLEACSCFRYELHEYEAYLFEHPEEADYQYRWLLRELVHLLEHEHFQEIQ